MLAQKEAQDYYNKIQFGLNAAAAENPQIAAAVESGQWDRVIDFVNKEVFDKPDEYYTLDKLRNLSMLLRPPQRLPSLTLRPFRLKWRPKPIC